MECHSISPLLMPSSSPSPSSFLRTQVRTRGVCVESTPSVGGGLGRVEGPPPPRIDRPHRPSSCSQLQYPKENVAVGVRVSPHKTCHALANDSWKNTKKTTTTTTKLFWESEEKRNGANPSCRLLVCGCGERLTHTTHIKLQCLSTILPLSLHFTFAIR